MTTSDEKDLSSWTFETDEVSAGVYVVSGRDSAGRSVERKGTDPDALLAECKEWARAMTRASRE